MTVNKLNVLVTGASGFLGANILKAFAGCDNVSVIAVCRDKSRLAAGFNGEVRQGDLRDPAYRRELVQGVDVICHAGTWAAMWGHASEENMNFYLPTLDLLEQAISAGCRRFIMTSTVAVTQPSRNGLPLDDFNEPAYTGFWPHLDRLVDIERYMQANCRRGMQMTVMRLGHFIGAGNRLGLVPALVPRLKSRLVPWLAGGRSRMPLIADTDLARSFVAATLADDLLPYESFNICGSCFPTTREVIDYIVAHTGVPKPLYSVPYPAGYLFGWLMETFFPVLPGKGPFLTRSIVHLAEDWSCSTVYARQKLGFVSQKNWQEALDEALRELKSHDYPWPYMTQKK